MSNTHTFRSLLKNVFLPVFMFCMYACLSSHTTRLPALAILAPLSKVLFTGHTSPARCAFDPVGKIAKNRRRPLAGMRLSFGPLNALPALDRRLGSMGIHSRIPSSRAWSSAPVSTTPEIFS